MSRLRAGDIVEVRPPAEILATLDEESSADRLPFMPEMLRFVGQRFTITARVEKVCDTFGGTGNRRFRDTVILDDLRCDGSAHDGCQAGCRLLWRASWVRPVDGAARAATGDPARLGELEERARSATRARHELDGQEREVYRCQATELVSASEPFPDRDLLKYVREVQCGNVGIGRFVRVCVRAVVRKLGRALGLWTEYALRPAPDASVDGEPLHLRPGELVQVKSKAEIARAIDENCRNRGLSFDWEMLPYCGGVYRVKDRVERIIDEGTGRMLEMKHDCIILDGVVCSGDLSEGRWFCPRAIYPYWREAWLRRVEAADEPRPGPP